ncbi:putative enoyl-CoA hydratase 1 [Variovorax sp. SRS16]|uniref:MaoC family dehydratase n=1 Tax=Variovorax sp. SRS16 TaxID=282217 RepID=UPI0013170EDF|nr:MaoC family dehydratase [Variovorax sp. SRS16]VTU29960.1 putative enoyl-CoA hydratase 1 [Variovorax sp. SRS16]
MPQRVFKNVAALAAAAGEELGVSDWFGLDQGRIDGFAGVTKDDFWLHTDPERAARESPHGKTLVHGMLTLSLMAHLARRIWRLDTMASGVNYGYDKVRFIAPVHPGDRVRLRRTLLAVEHTEHGCKLRFKDVMEIEGRDKPACIAENISIYQAA